MSVLQNFVWKGCLTSTQYLPQRFPVSAVQVRYRSSRKQSEKLAQPTDKSKVVIGKVKKIYPFSLAGVSDKQYPIMMKWNKPTRIQTCNPAISGDIGGLQHFGEVDLAQPPVQLEGSRSLEDVDAEVRRILSLEFGRKKDVIKKLRKSVGETVKRHPLDETSLEYRIAMLTITIRNFQRDLIERFPYKNQPLKHDLTHKIALRRQLIESLREQDYKKYEWLLERLNLFYKPVPVYDHIEISRKASIERLTDMWCDELQKHRLNAFRRELEEEQPKFLRAKAEKLSFIMQEEKDLGLDQSVTQAEVDECLARAEAIEKRNAATEHQDEEYLLYEEEKEVEQNVFLN